MLFKIFFKGYEPERLRIFPYNLLFLLIIVVQKSNVLTRNIPSELKTFTRKKFIKLGLGAGAAVFLQACGLGGNKKKNGDLGQLSDTGHGLKTPDIASSSSTLDILDKSDPRYDTLRSVFNQRIDKYPAYIALCTKTEEVGEAVAFAMKKKLPIAIKSGGHSMEGFSSNDNGLMINLSKMNQIEMLGDGKIKVGPGCTLSHLYDNILPKGLLLPTGSCASVGLGGLALGGGYGLFARKYGLTCDHLLEATLVDGQGNIHSTKDDAELLWALKGGGNGNYGIVTEMVFNTQKAPATLQAHHFKSRHLNPETAAKLLQDWMDIAAQLPESCFSGYVLNGHTLNILVTNYELGNEALPPLLDHLAGLVDEFHSSKETALAKKLKNYYGSDHPVYFRNSSAGLYKSFSDISSCITEVFTTTMNTPGMIFAVNTLGGQVKNPDFKKRSAFPHREFNFVSELQAYGNNTPAQNKSLGEATDGVLKLIAQNGINAQYVNYCSLQFNDWEKNYYGENYPRLQAIKRKYDPNNNIRHPLSVRG